MKKLSVILAAILSISQAYAITTEELASPKPPLNRLNLDYQPENKFELLQQDTPVKKTNQIPQDRIDSTRYTYADLSLNKLANEITGELDLETENITEDVKTLWVGAATRSETISYAMYKLANPDKDKPSDNVVKKIIRPVASLTSLAGISAPNPILATSAMVGGNLMRALTSDNKEINYQYSKVTDANMVVLVRKIDDLQRELTNKYCDYMSARKTLKMASEITKKRLERVETMSANAPKSEILIADAYYRDSINFETKKRAEYLAKRSALEQLVGNETLHLFEDNLNKRENSSD